MTTFMTAPLAWCPGATGPGMPRWGGVRSGGEHRRPGGRGAGAAPVERNGAPLPTSSEGTPAAEHGAHRADEDLEVQGGGPVVHVPEVQPDGLLPVQRRPPAHLPQAGHAG